MTMRDVVNPYASPMDEAAYSTPDAVPSARLFTPGQVIAASLVASAIAGAVLVAINEVRLGRGHRAPWIVAVGIGLLALAVAVGYAVPRVPGLPLAAGLAAVMYATAKHFAGRDIEEHLRRGGLKAGAGSVVGWSLLGLLLALVVVLGVVAVGEGPRAFLPPSEASIAPGQRVLYHDDLVEPAEAQHLARRLHELEIYEPGHAADVQLDKHDGSYDLCFFVDANDAESPSNQVAWRDMLGDILPQIYPDANVTAGLCEPEGTRKAEVYP